MEEEGCGGGRVQRSKSAKEEEVPKRRKCAEEKECQGGERVPRRRESAEEVKECQGVRATFKQNL